MNTSLQLESPNIASLDSIPLAAVIDALPNGLAIITQGRVLGANRAFVKLFGHANKAEIVGRRLSELVPHFCTETGDRSDKPTPCWIGTVAGAPADVQVSIQVLDCGAETNGQQLSVVIAHPIQVCPEDSSKAEESQRMEALGRLVSSVVHDFNNLLTGIMLYSDLLIADLAQTPRPQRYAEEIGTASRHGAALVRQLLAITRDKSTATGAMSWNEVIVEMRDLLTRLVGESTEFRTNLADRLGPVRLGAVAMRQVLLNLVLNARDAMPGGGRIVAKTDETLSPLTTNSEPGAWIELTVTDTGCGMTTETLSQLFQPFFTTKGPQKGNGIGLYTIRSLITQAGGNITVESTPGKGTEVRVRLPRVELVGPKIENEIEVGCHEHDASDCTGSSSSPGRWSELPELNDCRRRTCHS